MRIYTPPPPLLAPQPTYNSVILSDISPQVLTECKQNPSWVNPPLLSINAILTLNRSNRCKNLVKKVCRTLIPAWKETCLQRAKPRDIPHLPNASGAQQIFQISLRYLRCASNIWDIKLRNHSDPAIHNHTARAASPHAPWPCGEK